MDFDKMMEIATWLGKNKDAIVISKMKELVKEGKFFITFWGHFSAGKSRLINNVIGRDILPVKTRETTAVLTYIQYGTKEECRIIYDNGKISSMDIENAKAIFQDSSDFPDIEKIDHVEIYLDNELLETGVVIVDTPGVNTLIQKHQDLAADAIEQAGKIVYVLGRSPTDVDRQFISKIHACGIGILFARTKCDNLNSSEENIANAIEKDKNAVEKIIGGKIDFIPVSSVSENEYHKNIEILRDTLSSYAKNKEAELSKSAEQRLKVFAAAMKSDLEAEKARLEEAINGNDENIQKQIDQCDFKIKELERILENADSKIERKVAEANRDAKTQIDDFVFSAIQKFDEAIEPICFYDDATDEIREKCDEMVEASIKKIQSIMDVNYSNIVAEEIDIIKKVSDNPDWADFIPEYTEIQQQNSRTIEMYHAKLLEIKQKLQEIRAEKNEHSKELESMEEFDEDAYNQAIKELDYELSQIPSGMALKMSENQPIQPSQVFKRVGQAADLAMLLLPGDAIVAGIKGMTNATKIAQALGKMGKAGEVILKAGTAIAKNANTIDKVRDVAYAGNQVFGLRPQNFIPTKRDKKDVQLMIDVGARKAGDAFEQFKVQKKAGNVLDFLSVAYWTEKIGRNFDSPPKMEVDEVEEERRKQARKDIEAQQRLLIDNRIAKKKELGLISTKEKELEERENEMKGLSSKIESEMKSESEKIARKSREEALENYKKSYREFFEKKVSALAADILSEYEKSASQNIVMFVSSQNTALRNEMEESKAQLQNLLKMKASASDSLKARLKKCNEYLEAVA